MIMLKIRFHLGEDTIDTIDGDFMAEFEEEWMTDPLIIEMIKDIDKSDVISPRIINSPIFGSIPPTSLSTGVKALILMYKYPDNEYWATACGDNCSKWIKKFGDELGITICLEHFMTFSDVDFLCENVETGEIGKYFDFIVSYGY